jgi:hypothetical protein
MAAGTIQIRNRLHTLEKGQAPQTPAPPERSGHLLVQARRAVFF